jgi:hypothetical protein
MDAAPSSPGITVNPRPLNRLLGIDSLAISVIPDDRQRGGIVHVSVGVVGNQKVKKRLLLLVEDSVYTVGYIASIEVEVYTVRLEI